MDSEFWELITFFRQRLSPQAYEKSKESAQLHQLAMLPKFVQDPDGNVLEIGRLYLQLQRDAQKIKPVLDQYATFIPTFFSSPDVAAHCRIQAIYTMVSTLALLLNSLLRLFHQSNPSLETENAFFCDGIMTQAVLASCYRPVGSAYMPLCLIVAWACTNNPARLAQIECVLAEYQSDFAEWPCMSRGIWLASVLNSHRERIALGKRLRLLGEDSDPLMDPCDRERVDSCCVL